MSPCALSRLPSVVLLLALAACANTPPGAPRVVIEPAAPTTLDPLVVRISEPAADPDDDQRIDYRYAWSRDGVPVRGLTGDTVAAEETARDQTWRVVVTPWDGEAAGPAASAEVVVANSVPVAERAAIEPGEPDSADDLTCVVDVLDLDEDEVELDITWAVNGAAAGTGPVLAADATVRGDEVVCTATPRDDVHTGEAVESPRVVVGDLPPAVDALAILPEPARVADTLVAEVETSDPDGDAVAVSLAWFLDGAQVHEGETLSGGFARGDVVTLVATLSDGTLAGEPVEVQATIANTAPVATALALDPAAPGTADTVTATLSAGDDDGDALTVHTEWSVDGVVVSTDPALDGATAFDRGQVLAVRAWAEDGLEDGNVLTAVVTVGNTPPALAAADLSPASATTDTVLTCVPAGWSDPDGDAAGYQYAWTVDGVSAGTGATLDGATAFDKHQAVVCTVTPDDGADTGTPVSTSTLTVANTPPGAPRVAASPDLAEDGEDIVCEVSLASTDDDGDAVSYGVAWDVDGVAWTGATATTTHPGDTIAAADTSVGETWTCTVTPDDGEDPGATASAAAFVCDPAGTGATGCVTLLGPADADVVIYGESRNSASGRRYATVGDVDADGNEDLVITTNEGTGGVVYLLSGPISAGMTLSGDGIALSAEAMNDYFGGAIAAPGDLDGDGYDDFVLASPNYDNSTEDGVGRAYFFYGPVTTSGAASTADAIIEGTYQYDYFGGAMSAPADYDGDGVADFLNASQYGGAPGYVYQGRVWIHFGGSYGGAYDADASADVIIDGQSSIEGVRQARHGGDHDGDGVEDVLLTALNYDNGGTTMPAVFLVRGPVTAGTYDTSIADATWTHATAYSLGSAASIGDVDGDGYDDFVASDSYDDTTARDAGAAWVLPGSASPAGGDVPSLAVAAVHGDASNDTFPDDLEGGDLDQDGYADLLAGSYVADVSATDGGCLYAFWGPVSGASLAGDATAMVCGDAAGDFVYDAEILDDLDGDGRPELGVYAARLDSATVTDAGAVMIFFDFP